MIDVDGLQKAFGKKREVEAVRGVTFAAPASPYSRPK